MKRTATFKALAIGISIFTVAAVGTYYVTAPRLNKPKSSDEVAGAFCPDMSSEEAYAAQRVQTYATLIPGQNGWVFRTKNDFRTDWHIKPETVLRMVALQEAMRTHNAELVIVMPPVRGMVHTKELRDADKVKYGLDNPQIAWDAYENFISELRNRGVNIVGINRDEVNDKFFYKRNHHWSSEGAKAAAYKVAQMARNLPQYAEIPKIAYASKALEPAPYKSSYDRAFRKICGTTVPPETTIAYETIPAADVNSREALFDEKTEPQVVLLGTSNSVSDSSQANFEGFLKEYLSTDVLNAAYAGAGIDTSIIAYMNSEHYKNNKPKIVVWEVPGYYELDTINDSVFTQAIPAAYGNCGENALMQTQFNGLATNSPLYASDDGNTMGPFPEGQDPRSGELGENDDLYVHLAFATPIKREFSLKFHYKAGETGATRIVKFKRSNRYPADGNFYTLFPAANVGAELNKIRLVLPDKMATADVNVQICSLPGRETSRNDESM